MNDVYDYCLHVTVAKIIAGDVSAALSVCREEASTRCHNGMCLPKSLSCDGVEYCSDGSTSDVLCRECAYRSTFDRYYVMTSCILFRYCR